MTWKSIFQSLTCLLDNCWIADTLVLLSNNMLTFLRTLSSILVGQNLMWWVMHDCLPKQQLCISVSAGKRSFYKTHTVMMSLCDKFPGSLKQHQVRWPEEGKFTVQWHHFIYRPSQGESRGDTRLLFSAAVMHASLVIFHSSPSLTSRSTLVSWDFTYKEPPILMTSCSTHHPHHQIMTGFCKDVWELLFPSLHSPFWA